MGGVPKIDKKMTKYTQKDYFLYLTHLKGVLEFLKKELKMVEKSGKKTLWYYGARKTLEHLNEEKGKNLTPHDVDTIIYALINQIKLREKT